MPLIPLFLKPAISLDQPLKILLVDGIVKLTPKILRVEGDVHLVLRILKFEIVLAGFGDSSAEQGFNRSCHQNFE
jgi:hypothetical protein